MGFKMDPKKFLIIVVAVIIALVIYDRLIRRDKNDLLAEV